MASLESMFRIPAFRILPRGSEALLIISVGICYCNSPRPVVAKFKMPWHVFLSEVHRFEQNLFLNKVLFINFKIFCLYRKGCLLKYLPEESRRSLDLPGLTLLNWTVLQAPSQSPSLGNCFLSYWGQGRKWNPIPQLWKMPSSWWGNSLCRALSWLTPCELHAHKVLECR